jgi:hypothetical protein
MQNSQTPAYPSFDEMGIYQAGMSKAEQASVQFIAAHLKAHGNYPDPKQTQALVELACYVLDYAVPMVQESLYPTVKADPDNLDPESILEDLE